VSHFNHFLLLFDLLISEGLLHLCTRTQNSSYNEYLTSFIEITRGDIAQRLNFELLLNRKAEIHPIKLNSTF